MYLLLYWVTYLYLIISCPLSLTIRHNDHKYKDKFIKAKQMQIEIK